MNITAEQFQLFVDQYNQLQDKATQILKSTGRYVLEKKLDPDDPRNDWKIIDRIVDCLEAKITGVAADKVCITPDFKYDGEALDQRLAVVYASFLPGSLSLDLLLSDNWEQELPARIEKFLAAELSKSKTTGQEDQ